MLDEPGIKIQKYARTPEIACQGKEYGLRNESTSGHSTNNQPTDPSQVENLLIGSSGKSARGSGDTNVTRWQQVWRWSTWLKSHERWSSSECNAIRSIYAITLPRPLSYHIYWYTRRFAAVGVQYGNKVTETQEMDVSGAEQHHRRCRRRECRSNKRKQIAPRINSFSSRGRVISRLRCARWKNDSSCRWDESRRREISADQFRESLDFACLLRARPREQFAVKTNDSDVK